MRDSVTSAIDLDALDREADAVAVEFGAAYPRAAGQIFCILAAIDSIDAEIARANARLSPSRALLPASARVRTDIRHARALWSSTISCVPFTPPGMRIGGQPRHRRGDPHRHAVQHVVTGALTRL